MKGSNRPDFKKKNIFDMSDHGNTAPHKSPKSSFSDMYAITVK